MAGFIKLHRGWENSPQFKNEPYCERAAWVWLLSNAAWKEILRHGGKGNDVTIQAGQIHVSDRSLASVWGWDKKRVRRFLAKLNRSKSVSANRTTNGTVLTIEKWVEYQIQGPTEGPTKGPLKDQHGTTQEEGKELKEEKNTHYAFFGKTIRLSENDMSRWRERYHGLGDIQAELGALDDWLQGESAATQKKWFHIVSGSLNKKHQASLRSGDGDDWGNELMSPC